MSSLTLLSRNATTFSPSKEFDEDAFRQFLQRFVDSGLGVYLASGGSGEGHTLSRDELRRVYEVGVEVCKGKVPVNANPPEQHTAQATIDHAELAIAAGVDVVNIYGPASLHGYRPTDVEYIAYFDEVFSVIKHSVALAPNPTMGYAPKASLIAELCNKYSQVVIVNLSRLDDTYFVDLRNRLKHDVALYVPLPGSLQTLMLGADGLLGAEANIVPKTFRKYLDLYEAKDFKSMSQVYVQLQRFMQYVQQWHTSSPRWLKMAMKVLKLPGGQGGVRKPYMMPPDEEVQRFTDGLLALGIPEVDDLARVAGLR